MKIRSGKIQKSEVLLLSMYAFMAIVWLVISVNNASQNITGNRTIGAGIFCVYLTLMSLGIRYFPRVFSVISTLNFMAGLGVVGWLTAFGWPDYNWFLLLVLVGGLAGLLLSIYTIIYQCTYSSNLLSQ